MDERTIGYERQPHVPAIYKDRLVGKYPIDLIVENRAIVEIKAVEHHHPVFETQILSYGSHESRSAC